MPSQQCPPTTITLLLTTKLTVPKCFAKGMPQPYFHTQKTNILHRDRVVKKSVDKFVENFGRKWKKMENFYYFCTR